MPLKQANNSILFSSLIIHKVVQGISITHIGEHNKNKDPNPDLQNFPHTKKMVYFPYGLLFVMKKSAQQFNLNLHHK
jgi:hypothetical protein